MIPTLIPQSPWALRVLALTMACLGTLPLHAETLPLRGMFPQGSGKEGLPVTGGIPFPIGALPSIDNIRLLDGGGKEIPLQVTRLAVWPDGSVKWALIDVVLNPAGAKSLALEYGKGIKRAPVPDPLKAGIAGGHVNVSGGGIRAAFRKTGGSVLDAFSWKGKSLIASGKPARLVVHTLRLADGREEKGYPTYHYACADIRATLEIGTVQIEAITVESPGPIRATICLRGHILLPRFGASLPKEVTDREPAGRMPFSLRLSFFRACGAVLGQHQIVFSGEPDSDFILRWEIRLPGWQGPRGTLILEPGVEVVQEGSGLHVAPEPSRLCWAPVRGGFAMIRKGWENRPCAVRSGKDAASITFWPREAGAWDLRRYAREWACGESGPVKDPKAMERYAKWAARGLAKSHDFVLWVGEGDLTGPAPPLVRALSSPALLVAPPAWYASTGALGPFAPEQTAGPFAALDAATRRETDYHLFCQDLFRWHGKLAYGFWQTRFGEIHRHDRWDRDYGRWGWSLNDGAGRIGHVLMLQFLRTLERRYFEAGMAFNRANYDTNMVHTLSHLENTRNWWTAKGCSHRHNVQPFGCPYIGMRGSYPVGARILHLLTGDGVIADGLEIVADAAFQYAEGRKSRLCNSGGSDGQGSAANALLWKYETTGEAKYFKACRKILDESGLIPPAEGKRLGYGPAFGLFHAAGEVALLSEDKAFQER
ncbi:MAG: RIFT barrel domain-containing protein, partial [Planctomycetota bacterium]